MKQPLRPLLISSYCVGILTLAASAQAQLAGTTTTLPGSTVFPGLVPPGTPAGTLIASLSDPFTMSTTAGVTSGTVMTAVFRESTGMLDFYYQVTNSPNSATSLARVTTMSFAGFQTFTGYRLDGSTVGPGFSNGTVIPIAADRNVQGQVVGFAFSPPDSAKIQPGMTSAVLVVSTNAVNFAHGDISLIDGGTATVPGFQPAPVPESGGLAVVAIGLATFCRRRRRR